MKNVAQAQSVLFAAFIAFASTGCGKVELTDAIKNGVPDAINSDSESSTWISDCLKSPGASGSTRLLVTFAQGKSSSTKQTYGYGNCNDKPTETQLEESVSVSSRSDTELTLAESDVKLKSIDSKEFATESGNFVEYAGPCKVGEEKICTAFAQFERPSDITPGAHYIRVISPSGEDWRWVAGGLRTSEHYKNVIKQCKNPQTIRVKAGVFKTCLEEIGDEKIWWGNVPVYGIVKFEKSGKLPMSYNSKPQYGNGPQAWELTSVGF